MHKRWQQELARDFIALGSIPFYVLVTARALIGQHMPFVAHVVLGFVAYHLLAILVKPSDPYIARGLILVIFTSFFYQATLFTVFVTVVWLLMFWAQSIRKIKWNALLGGALLGVISAAVSYFLTLQLL